jgi:hypothetical protein
MVRDSTVSARARNMSLVSDDAVTPPAASICTHSHRSVMLRRPNDHAHAHRSTCTPHSRVRLLRR